MTDRPKFAPDAYRVPQKPGEGVAAFFGKWPGDETDEEIARLLAEQEQMRSRADAKVIRLACLVVIACGNLVPALPYMEDLAAALIEAGETL